MSFKFTIFLASILLLSCTSKKKETAEDVLDDSIVYIKNERYDVVNGNPDATSMGSYIVSNFDEEGNEVSSVYYSSDNSIMMQFKNRYEDNLKTRVDWVNSQDSLVRVVLNTYNQTGSLERSESYSPAEEFLSGFIHRWSEDGLTEEKGPIAEGDFKPNAIYTYNENKDFVLLKEYDENDSLYATVQWEYKEFDDRGNWTVRHMITNDTLNRIEKREIKYEGE